MTAVLLTGMSGVGKSAVLVELACRGLNTVDTDLGEWVRIADATSPYPGERIWDAKLMRRLLGAARADPLVVSGTVINQGEFYDAFDAVVLLTVDVDEALRRARTRTTNPFGSTPDEQEAIRRDFAEVEPLLTRRATHVIDTTPPLAEVVDEVWQIVQASHLGDR